MDVENKYLLIGRMLIIYALDISIYLEDILFKGVFRRLETFDSV